jgi:hypothetical protein
VRRILVGFRDDNGAVQKLQTLETLKLPAGRCKLELLSVDPPIA